MSEEISVWSDSPSQWINAGKFAACGLQIVVALVALGAIKTGGLASLKDASLVSVISSALVFWALASFVYAFWAWLSVKCTRYELSSERLRTSKGVLNKTVDELELYRVKDYRTHQPILLRIFGLGDIILVSSDKITREIVIRAVNDPVELSSGVFRDLIEKCRDRKRVREID